MGRMIIVGGASGAGKSFLLEHISLLDSSIIPVRKLTTRNPRSYETDEIRLHLDLDFGHTKKEVVECDYKYLYARTWYGTKKSDIDAVLRQGQNPILIVRDCETIYRILRDYPDALVIYLQSGLSGNDLRKKLRLQGREDMEIEKRMILLKRDFDDYVRHINLFHHMLVNYFEEEGLLDQIRSILRYELPQDTMIPGFVFVLMPFKKEFQKVYKAICTAGRLLNGKPLRIERLDERRGVMKITDKILQSIRQAALVIAEVTEHNPNVFFETGYARGIGKPVLPCAKKGTSLPFDLYDDNTVFYEDPQDLQDQLSEHLREQFPFFLNE